jgi:hypothetical protein
VPPASSSPRRPRPKRGRRPTICLHCSAPLGESYRDRLCRKCGAALPVLHGLGTGLDTGDTSCLFGFDPAFDAPIQLSLLGDESGEGG